MLGYDVGRDIEGISYLSFVKVDVLDSPVVSVLEQTLLVPPDLYEVLTVAVELLELLRVYLQNYKYIIISTEAPKGSIFTSIQAGLSVLLVVEHLIDIKEILCVYCGHDLVQIFLGA